MHTDFDRYLAADGQQQDKSNNNENENDNDNDKENNEANEEQLQASGTQEEIERVSLDARNAASLLGLATF